MATRTFRARLEAPSGQYFSKSYVRNRGFSGRSSVPADAAAPHFCGRARGALRTVASGLGARGDFTIQLFADDSSVAIRGQGGLQLIKLAHNLVGIRERAFGEIGLALSVLKRKNSPVRALDESRVYLREGVQLPDG